jgi:hypothetical protein
MSCSSSDNPATAVARTLIGAILAPSISRPKNAIGGRYCATTLSPNWAIALFLASIASTWTLAALSIAERNFGNSARGLRGACRAPAPGLPPWWPKVALRAGDTGLVALGKPERFVPAPVNFLSVGLGWCE